jgi:hypothetical protein
MTHCQLRYLRHIDYLNLVVVEVLYALGIAKELTFFFPLKSDLMKSIVHSSNGGI